MIRFADKRDIPYIMKFIDEHWRKGHILAHNRQMFEYEFVEDEKVNVAISVDDGAGEINGMEAFIVYGKKNRYVFLSIWKVIHTANPTLGVEILQFIIKNADTCCVSSPGINKKTIPIYKYLGIHTGIMTQWYRLGQMDDFQIAKIKNPMRPVIQTSCDSILKRYDNFDELQKQFDFEKYYKSSLKPLKEKWYVEKRYFRHPLYKYQVYGIEKEGKAETILVIRVQEYENHNAIRLVDVIGNYQLFYSATKQIDELLEEYQAEYADIYETGLSDEDMKKAGWLSVMGSGNIIPNYFSPFVQENIDIYYMSQDSDIVLFKADGDQDRPN